MTKQVPIKETAFVRYLLSIPRPAAINHMITCLASGGPENAAYELMSEMHDDWSCLPEDLFALIGKTLDKIEEERNDSPKEEN